MTALVPPAAGMCCNTICERMTAKRMKRILMLIPVLAGTLLVEGCMWSRMRINDPSVAERARVIRPGITRADQVADIIGAQPTLRMPQKDYTLFGYTYGDTKSNGLILILFNFTRSTTMTDTLYIETDNETGLVSHVYFPKHHEVDWRFWPFD